MTTNNAEAFYRNWAGWEPNIELGTDCSITHEDLFALMESYADTILEKESTKCPFCLGFDTQEKGASGYNLNGSEQEANWMECNTCNHKWNK